MTSCTKLPLFFSQQPKHFYTELIVLIVHWLWDAARKRGRGGVENCRGHSPQLLLSGCMFPVREKVLSCELGNHSDYQEAKFPFMYRRTVCWVDGPIVCQGKLINMWQLALPCNLIMLYVQIDFLYKEH